MQRDSGTRMKKENWKAIFVYCHLEGRLWCICSYGRVQNKSEGGKCFSTHGQ